jgi:hypothetical protein
MAIEVNKVMQSTVKSSSNLSAASIALSENLKRFDIHLHGGELMATPMTGNEIFNVE